MADEQLPLLGLLIGAWMIVGQLCHREVYRAHWGSCTNKSLLWQSFAPHRLPSSRKDWTWWPQHTTSAPSYVCPSILRLPLFFAKMLFLLWLRLTVVSSGHKQKCSEGSLVDTPHACEEISSASHRGPWHSQPWTFAEAWGVDLKSNHLASMLSHCSHLAQHISGIACTGFTSGLLVTMLPQQPGTVKPASGERVSSSLVHLHFQQSTQHLHNRDLPCTSARSRWQDRNLYGF